MCYVTQILYVYQLSLHSISEEKLDFITVCVHLVNSLYVMLDLFITAVPFRILHLWLPEIFGISYTCFSVFHWGYTGAEPIYHVLDYQNSPGMSAIYLLTVAFVASPLFHILTFCIYWLRRIIYARLCVEPLRNDATDIEKRATCQYQVNDKDGETVHLNIVV